MSDTDATLFDFATEAERRRPAPSQYATVAFGATAPACRLEDPETSHRAASSVRTVSMTRRLILDLLISGGPATDEQIEAAWRRAGNYPATGQSLRSRRAELVKDGLVEATGDTRPTSTGRSSQVWRAAIG